MSIFISNHKTVIASVSAASFAALDVRASGDIDTPLRIAEENAAIILSNLADNAKRHGGTVLKISVARCEAVLVVTVGDNGESIACSAGFSRYGIYWLMAPVLVLGSCWIAWPSVPFPLSCLRLTLRVESARSGAVLPRSAASTPCAAPWRQRRSNSISAATIPCSADRS